MLKAIVYYTEDYPISSKNLMGYSEEHLLRLISMHTRNSYVSHIEVYRT